LLTGVDGRSVFEQKAGGFEVAGCGSGVQWHDLGRIRGYGVDRRSAFDEQTGGFGLAEKTGEMQRGEAVF
jgi:hypothetical protein